MEGRGQDPQLLIPGPLIRTSPVPGQRLKGKLGGGGARTGQLHHTKTAGATSPVSWPGDLPRSAQAEALGNTD